MAYSSPRTRQIRWEEAAEAYIAKHGGHKAFDQKLWAIDYYLSIVPERGGKIPNSNLFLYKTDARFPPQILVAYYFDEHEVVVTNIRI